MPVNIRQLKESIGIHLLFLLALTSAFLGVYITVYDLFSGGIEETPSKEVSNLPYELIGTPLGTLENMSWENKNKYLERFHRTDQMKRIGNQDGTLEDLSLLDQKPALLKHDHLQDSDSNVYNSVTSGKFGGYRFMKSDGRALRYLKPYEKKKVPQLKYNQAQQSYSYESTPLSKDPGNHTVDSALADIHKKMDQLPFQMRTVFLSKQIPEKMMNVHIMKKRHF